ncbi:hypothetical protein E3N88_30341 [Mikania micrantha]|uniref:Protein kinase domain-containing protein n=1 Tax=Mikania micrantha TaxID=192012 RepID=A0A5N6MNI6_9ASTR|nr:hypothetical protein E3N88_30341 [Mikania micrantha]
MRSGNEFFSAGEFNLEAKWLIDPKLLFVGPKIGEGAHAKVYEGKYKNKIVAIKLVNKGDTPEEIAKIEGRFVREVAMLSKVQHKNLVKFIGACKEPMMVIVTELLTGGTLRKYLVNMRPNELDTHVAIGFALDIARAMECLHSHGIIHRDLKPENLLLTADHKSVKLADFGLAREESLTEMMTAETGTYRWMAPELYSTVTLRHGEKKHYNHKVDAYSFAIVLWELMHNKLPFEGMSNLQAAYAAAFKNVRPSADDLQEDLAHIVTSCWQEDPNARPNFTQIIQMLHHYLSKNASSPPTAIPPRIFTSQNAVFLPPSPGTSTLIEDRDETPKTPMEKNPRASSVKNEPSPSQDFRLQAESELTPGSVRSWLVDGRTLAKKIKTSGLFSAHQVMDSGAPWECPQCSYRIHKFDESSEWPGLPKGVKFDPTDVELMDHLAAKCGVISEKPHEYIDVFIPTIEFEQGICYKHPENLPGARKDGNSFHLFYQTTNAYTKGQRKRRKICDKSRLKEDVRWHKTGKTKAIFKNGDQIGWKKILVLYGTAIGGSKPCKMNWVMHQYHLGANVDEKDGEYVVSKIFYQAQKQTEHTDVRVVDEASDPRTPIINASDPLRPGKTPLYEDVTCDYIVQSPAQESECLEHKCLANDAGATRDLSLGATDLENLELGSPHYVNLAVSLAF